MKYKAGDKVVIVGHRTPQMSQMGGMDKYLGLTMTIDYIKSNGGMPTYKMMEDSRYWYWNDNMIDHEATAMLNRDVYKRF